MADLTSEQQYQKEYDEARAKLDAAADGFKPDPITATEAEPAKVEVAEPAKAAEAAPVVDELAELRAKVEKAEKALKDTQAWGTKNAQRLAEIEREVAIDEAHAQSMWQIAKGLLARKPVCIARREMLHRHGLELVRHNRPFTVDQRRTRSSGRRHGMQNLAHGNVIINNRVERARCGRAIGMP